MAEQVSEQFLQGGKSLGPQVPGVFGFDAGDRPQCVMQQGLPPGRCA